MTAIISCAMFGEPMNWFKAVCLALILVGVIGLNIGGGGIDVTSTVAGTGLVTGRRHRTSCTAVTCAAVPDAPPVWWAA
eukprot:CAMPEP_0206063346 /NCGR_PEP_ID=MMETSP1466-20131121/58184_1 /ASSEMBLY_ACC=CAM_ASM_001126 /TAXON_ID=44452 /ORGANISM="Pavlova gyrans, Strain CCMP608" /LENGTH=78 /DNA_ID=CAMNT_0053438715 /DNA_START=660 /DNA_END=897 /DNA_ORIENTATION=-